MTPYGLFIIDFQGRHIEGKCTNITVSTIPEVSFSKDIGVCDFDPAIEVRGIIDCWSHKGTPLDQFDVKHDDYHFFGRVNSLIYEESLFNTQFVTFGGIVTTCCVSGIEKPHFKCLTKERFLGPEYELD
jgi:hypothetical protein